VTWHFFAPEDFECAECSAQFIPYLTPQECPRCGSMSESPTSFLADVVSGLRTHKINYGCYVSGAYFAGSLAEATFYWCCQILDAASAAHTGVPTIESVRQHLETINWGDQAHMKGYFSALLGHVIPRLLTLR